MCWLDQNKSQPTWTKAAGRQLHSPGRAPRGPAREEIQVVVAPELNQHFSWNFPNKDDRLLGGDSYVGAVPKENERQRGSRRHVVTFDVHIESCRK